MRTRAEAPGPGDTDVSGTALITPTQDQGKVRSTCAWAGIDSTVVSALHSISDSRPGVRTDA